MPSEMSTSAVDAMINGQLKPNEVNDPAILGAIRSVPREKFVPKAMRGFAYVDEDLEVSAGRYLMEPMVFGRLLVAANVKPSDTVLDIGGVTGYSAAVFSYLAEAVVALENDDSLVDSANKKLEALDIVNVAVLKDDLVAGAAKQGPFDVIFVNGLVEDIPSALFKQLAEGGRLVCVKLHGAVGRAHLVTKHDGLLQERNLFDASVAPLPGFEAKSSFEF